MIQRGQRFAREGILEAERRGNVARVNFRHIFAPVREHPHHAPDAFLAILRGVEHRRTSRDHAGIHAEKSQPPDKGIGLNLEDQRGQRLIVGGMSFYGFVVLGINTLDGRNIERGRQVINHGIEQKLDTAITQRRTAQHRMYLPMNSSRAQRFEHGPRR